jgi:hypothetical protein
VARPIPRPSQLISAGSSRRASPRDRGSTP